MRKGVLILVLLSVLILLTACGKTEEAQAVDEMILSLGEINEDSETDISEVESAYNELSEREQKSLDNYALLVNARNTYNQIKADAVKEAINDIGTVNEDSGQVLERVRDIYDSLSDSQKGLVGNYSTLTDAEESYGLIQIGIIENLINSIGEVSLSTECAAAIQAAESAYQELDDSLKSKVGNYRILLEAKDRYNSLSPLQLNSYRIEKSIIGYPELFVDAENISDKIIKSYVLRIFAYDKDGVPVKVRFDDFTIRLNDTNAIKPGESANKNGYWTLYGDYHNMQQIVLYVEEIEFFDGTTWENPQSNTLFAKYNETILEAGDENVLQRN